MTNLSGQVKDIVLGHIDEFVYAPFYKEPIPIILLLMENGSVCYFYADILWPMPSNNSFKASIVPGRLW